MLTIGRLARYVGVSTKAIRVYHDKGLLPEPDRDSSGYRRYGVGHAIDLIRIRALAGAGVPLARIRGLLSATDEEFRTAVDQIDDELSARIRGLQAARERLHRLADGNVLTLPDEVGRHLATMTRLGFSRRMVDLQTELWTLVFIARPDTAGAALAEEARVLAEPALCRIVLAYDRAHDLDPHDPRIGELAREIADAVRDRYPLGDPTGSGSGTGSGTGAQIPALVQATVNASSPAWHRLDTLIREHLTA